MSCSVESSIRMQRKKYRNLIYENWQILNLVLLPQEHFMKEQVQETYFNHSCIRT